MHSLDLPEESLKTTKRNKSRCKLLSNIHSQITSSSTSTVLATDTVTTDSLDGGDSLFTQNKTVSPEDSNMIGHVDHQAVCEEERIHNPDTYAEAKENWPSSLTDHEDISAEDLDELFRGLESNRQESRKFKVPQIREKRPPSTIASQARDKAWTTYQGGLSTYADGAHSHKDLERGTSGDIDLLNPLERSITTTLDFSSLLKRRKLDISNVESSFKKSKETTLKRKRSHPASPKGTNSTRPTPMSALTRFLAVKLGTVIHDNREDECHNVIPTAALLVQEPPPNLREEQHQPQINVPLPHIPVALPKVQCVISSTLITYRGILRRIRNLYPLAEFIERDFGDQASISRQNANTPAIVRPWCMPEAEEESDIIISPTTGVILATIQKLHQRPLPGSNAPQALQARLTALAPKYEHIVLLVSQRLSGECSPMELSPLDASAIAEITAFGQLAYFKNLGTSISVILSLGGEEQAAHWLIALIVKHCRHSEPCGSLRQDDTSSEVWLRKLGLNTYAAQTILAKLEATASHSLSLQESPLAALVRMSVSERMLLLSQLLGRSAADRLNFALDTPFCRWGQG